MGKLIANLWFSHHLPQLLPVVSPLLVANIFVVRPAQLIDVFIDELSETAGKRHPVFQRFKLENHPL